MKDALFSYFFVIVVFYFFLIRKDCSKIRIAWELLPVYSCLEMNISPLLDLKPFFLMLRNIKIIFKINESRTEQIFQYIRCSYGKSGLINQIILSPVSIIALIYGLVSSKSDFAKECGSIRKSTILVSFIKNTSSSKLSISSMFQKTAKSISLCS